MEDKSTDAAFSKIKNILKDLYGDQAGALRYEYLYHKAEKYLQTLSDKARTDHKDFNSADPYKNLAGKIFAITYPDNVYIDDEYTLITLQKTLEKYFPSIKGLHLLPERTMSHSDIWPQDFFAFFPKDMCQKIVSSLMDLGIIDEFRNITALYPEKIEIFKTGELKKITGDLYSTYKDSVLSIIDNAYNSHFNDGGFSQKTRAEVDPRFGKNSNLHELTNHFATMLDYVVNHLDVDNDYLEEFRKGNNDGDAFLIIYRDRYRQLLADRTLEKTFRPRPFPLFTGLRKYPVASLDGEKITPLNCAAEMNRIFTANGLKPLDSRLILFLSIFFKVENDQGLTAQDFRIFTDFEIYASEAGIDISPFWLHSEIQAKQKKFNSHIIDSMETFMVKLGLSVKYADLFRNDSDHIFGREFYIYTTFSESQADVNPLSFEGFKMIIDDLFHLLSSGSLTMMRMDAIKYLWKEIGAINFDMEEGNKLIDAIRLLMKITSPSTLPLDEINSPDPIVYSMAKDGGFAYLFGQVNSVPAAFNEGNLEPLVRFNQTMKEKCPPNLLRFVMLSTHDGRSVQGLGVQRSDGHVSVEQFYKLKDTVESRGGKPKFRSVPKGEIAGDTFRKIFTEADFKDTMHKLHGLFDSELIQKKDLFRLKDQDLDESDLLEEISLILDIDVRSLMGSAPIDYFIQWIIYGKTAYELCCTTRSALSRTDSEGNSLTEEEEAQRLVLAQLFVLTQGQDVPAIYFNDLLGLENDYRQYEITGKPRDLNRHKNNLKEMTELMENDPFTKSYTEKLNTILALRAEDSAFYPGSTQFQFSAFTDQIFMNHPWHEGHHSVILGNIGNQESLIEINTSAIEGFTSSELTDRITGTVFQADNSKFTIKMSPYGYYWLK
ncbi:MAG: hypothetical protein JEY91_11390 [Spirochaetaceae bacterium]|nr:hypothetical protein [Spirochaetaceae bacterium]